LEGEQDPVVVAFDLEGLSDHFGAVDTHLQYDWIVLERLIAYPQVQVSLALLDDPDGGRGRA
jgi:uncharacterized protein involved in copper resistance